MIQSDAREAWRELEQKLRPFIGRRVQNAADADDVLQDVLLRLHTGLSNLRDEQRFGPWVYQIARNAIVDHGRRTAHQVQAAVVHEDGCDREEDGEATDAAEPERMMAAYVGRFVALLPSPYRETLTLTELEGLSHKVAAELLGVSLTCLKSRVQRGREKLREAFLACCQVALDARGRVMACEPRSSGGRVAACRCEPPTPRGR